MYYFPQELRQRGEMLVSPGEPPISFNITDEGRGTTVLAEQSVALSVFLKVVRRRGRPYLITRRLPCELASLANAPQADRRTRPMGPCVAI